MVKLHFTLIKKIASNINRFFNKTSKKRDLSGESNPEEDKKRPEGEVLQLAILMPLRMKYYNRSVQQMIFRKCQKWKYRRHIILVMMADPSNLKVTKSLPIWHNKLNLCQKNSTNSKKVVRRKKKKWTFWSKKLMV